MLEGMRQGAKGPAGKVIVVVLVLAFGLWGVSSVVPLVFGARAPVTVNGEDISANEIASRVQQERQQLLQQFDGQIDPSMITEEIVRPQVMERLIQQRLIAQAARDADFVLSSDAVDRVLAREPAFQNQGRFDSQAFSRIAAQQGMTPTQLRDAIADSEVTNQWVSGLQSTEFVLPFQIEQYGEYSNQRRDIEYVILQPEDYRDDVSVSETEIAQYYDANQEDFATPEQVAVEYVVYPRSRLEENIEPTEDELQQAYQAYTASEGDGGERSIAHILITVEERSAAEAEELAESLQARAQDEDFADLAETYSDDPGSAAFGGDLGVFQTGVFGDAFEAAVTDMNEAGDISPVVETEFGYHVIQLTDIESEALPSFDDMRDELRAELVERQIGMQLSVVRDEVANIAFSGLDLSELADTFELEIETSELFTRDGGDGVLANPDVVSAAFSDTVLQEELNSDVIRLDDSSLVVLRKADYVAPDTRPLAEVEDEISNHLQRQKARAAAGDEAERIYEALRSGESINVSLERRNDITRFSDELAGSILDAVFRTPLPEDASGAPFRADARGGSWAVGRVVEVRPGEVTDEEREQVAQFMQETVQSSAIDSAYRDLRENASIRVR